MVWESDMKKWMKRFIYLILIGLLGLLIAGGGLFLMLSGSIPLGGATVLTALLGAGSWIVYQFNQDKNNNNPSVPAAPVTTSYASSNQQIDAFLNEQARKMEPPLRSAPGVTDEGYFPSALLAKIKKWFTTNPIAAKEERKITAHDTYEEMTKAEENCIALSYETREIAFEDNDFYEVLGFTTHAVTDEAIKRQARRLFLELNFNRERNTRTREEEIKLGVQIDWIKKARDVLLGISIDNPKVDQAWQEIRKLRIERIEIIQGYPEIWRQIKEEEEKTEAAEKRAQEETRKREEETRKREAAERLAQEKISELEALKKKFSQFQAKGTPDEPPANSSNSCTVM